MAVLNEYTILFQILFLCVCVCVHVIEHFTGLIFAKANFPLFPFQGEMASTSVPRRHAYRREGRRSKATRCNTTQHDTTQQPEADNPDKQEDDPTEGKVQERSESEEHRQAVHNCMWRHLVAESANGADLREDGRSSWK